MTFDSVHIAQVCFSALSTLVCLLVVSLNFSGSLLVYFRHITFYFTLSNSQPRSNVIKSKIKIKNIKIFFSGSIQDNEDCSYYKNINKPSGVYIIQPEGVSNGLLVYCDMDRGSSGWIVSISLNNV